MGLVDSFLRLRIGEVLAMLAYGICLLVWVGAWTFLCIMVGSMMVAEVEPYYGNTFTEVTCVGVKKDDAVMCGVAEGTCRGWAVPLGEHLSESNFTYGDTALVYVDAACENWDYAPRMRTIMAPSAFALMMPIGHMSIGVGLWWFALGKCIVSVVGWVRGCLGRPPWADEDDFISMMLGVGALFYVLYLVTMWSLALHIVVLEASRVADVKDHPETCTVLWQGLGNYVDVQSNSCKIVRAYSNNVNQNETFDCYVAPDCSSADQDPDQFDPPGALIALSVAIALFSCIALLLFLKNLQECIALGRDEPTDADVPLVQDGDVPSAVSCEPATPEPAPYDAPVQGIAINVTGPPPLAHGVCMPAPLPCQEPPPYPHSQHPLVPPSLAGSSVGLDGSRDLWLAPRSLGSRSQSETSYGRVSFAAPAPRRLRM